MDSPFTSRLDSNYVATDAESLEIHTLLEPPASRLEELSTQLQELDDQYTQLRNEQSSLLLFISKHRALISQIRKLPIDILQEIFIACLPTAHNAVMSRWEPPILLTQICSSWRNVAHTTPQLWKSIHIAVPCNRSGRFSGEYSNFPSTQEEHIDQRSEAVQEWLSRSGAHPLEISVGHWGTSALDGFYDKIIDSLILYSERWKDVRVSAPFQALVPVAVLPPSKVPLLESLSLNCPPVHPFTQHDPQSVWMTSGVLKAPKLRELWLRGLWLAQLNEDVTRLPINWSQLTNISLEGSAWGASSGSLSISRAYNLLSLCPNLITCRLEIVTAFNELPLEPDAPLISLPFLTKLSIREESANLSELFTLLHFPSLDYIEFHTTIQPSQQSTTSLLSLLTGFHKTTQLTTDAQFFTRQDFVRCLRLCPFLKSLWIRKVYAMGAPPGIPACRVDDEFLKLFIESSSDGGYLCPLLEDFESSSETAFSETALLQFVKVKNGGSRTTTTGLAKLKRLSVLFYCRSLCDIKQELEPYEQAGLVTSINYPLTAPFSAFGGLPGYLPPF